MAMPPKKRSIDFLTEDQLWRKREVDRKNQRLARDRTRAEIRNLELRVLQLEHQNEDLQRKLSLCKCQIDTPTPSTSLPLFRDANWDTRNLGIDIVQIEGDNQERWMSVLQDIMNGTPQDYQMTEYPNYKLIVNPQLPTTNAIWSQLPKYTIPTCPLDQIVTALIQARRPYELFGGNFQEFQKRPFPSIQSLINPTDDAEAEKSPVTSTIVNSIIQVFTVPALPEQIAILYFMGSIIRWLISSTEANYISMPEWLRPTPAQLSNPHPVWMDLFVWPKARDRLCRSAKYHNQNPLMTEVCNESVSINWPYQLSDMLMQANGQGSEIVLTPSFDRHIKDLRNWTVGPRFLEVFPEFVDDVKIGRPRALRH